MKKVDIPGTQLSVSALCMGTADHGTASDETNSLALIGLYLESGGNFIDTAHCYGGWEKGGNGNSERSVGQALRRFGRHNFVLATKGGHPTINEYYPRPDQYVTEKTLEQDLAQSLERLGVDQIDLYYLHRDDPRQAPEELIEMANRVATPDCVRYLGASNWHLDRVRTANKFANANGLRPFVAWQNQWCLATPTWGPNPDDPGTVRFVRPDEVATIGEREILVAPYSATGNGFFASGGQVGHSFHSPENFARLARVETLAKELGVTPNQVSLAFLLSHPFPVSAIIGTKNQEHLRDAVGATSLKLNEEQLSHLELGN